MDINTGAQQDSHYLGARINEKGCLQVLGGDALRGLSFEPCTSLNLLDNLDEFWTHIYNNCHPKWIAINLCIMVMMAIHGRKVNQIHKILTVLILSRRCQKTQSFIPKMDEHFRLLRVIVMCRLQNKIFMINLDRGN
jgi:hypothetical protein